MFHLSANEANKSVDVRDEFRRVYTHGLHHRINKHLRTAGHYQVSKSIDVFALVLWEIVSNQIEVGRGGRTLWGGQRQDWRDAEHLI